jgi:hypothetical protein
MLLLFFYFIKMYFMCLVVMNGEVKKSFCKCGGQCKREQKWAEKMSRIGEVAEQIDLTVLLREAQALQYHTALNNPETHYEESYHLRLR